MDRIFELIQSGYECEYLDFKERQYSKENHIDFIKDIMAMANSRYHDDKYIIIGIKDRPEGKEIKGIPHDEFIDSSIYSQVILSNIEPEINFDYFKYKYENKILGIFKIYNNENPPYMLKRKKGSLNQGFCLIRKNSMNTPAIRHDFDFMYRKQERFELQLRENVLHAVHDFDGCASIEILISNLTNSPITVVRGVLVIKNDQDEELSHHRVFGFNEYVGADFQLSLLPKTEVVGQLMVSFETSDPFRLDIDEHGISAHEFTFELILWDGRNNEYITTSDDCRVFADGDFLWKVKKKKGIPHKFRTHKRTRIL